MSPDEQDKASAEIRRAILDGTATAEHIARGDYCEDDILAASQEIARLRIALEREGLLRGRLLRVYRSCCEHLQQIDEIRADVLRARRP